MAIGPIQAIQHSVSFTELESAKNSIRKAFNTVKEEMDEHREAINDNTNEIHANYEHMMSLEKKIDKLSERIDELFLMFKEGPMPQKISLTRDERSVFLQLYMVDDFLCAPELAQNLKLPTETVERCIQSMSTKGVNLATVYKDKKAYVRMDPSFREQHARTGIVQVEATIN